MSRGATHQPVDGFYGFFGRGVITDGGHVVLADAGWLFVEGYWRSLSLTIRILVDAGSIENFCEEGSELDYRCRD